MNGTLGPVALFRVEARNGAPDALLGYQWVEVLAIEPNAIGERTRGYGDWLDRQIVCDYVCLTESGLIKIRSSDFWAAMEQYQEYDEQTPQPNPPQVVVTTGDASVVQTGGYMGRVKTKNKNIGNDLADIPMPALAVELQQLREELASKAMQADDFVTVGAVAEAEEAASEGDARKVRKALFRAGRAALQASRDIGVDVAAAAITRSMGGA